MPGQEESLLSTEALRAVGGKAAADELLADASGRPLAGIDGCRSWKNCFPLEARQKVRANKLAKAGSKQSVARQQLPLG